MESKEFIHPLSILETIETDEGQKQVMNSWAFASMVWTSAVAGNTNALSIVNELFTNKDEIPSFLEASQAGNEGAIAGAIAIIAFAIDDKLAEAFENKV
ncbi:hypothetical protein [Microcoleus sp. D3_18a_C4]|uniref:hypothetical protein n=1 Tax=unclassified Microcoleus TaxID=2642155 RepID=UPI002FD5DAEE